MRVHTGEQPYQCPVCSFQSARRDNLNLHTKKSHGMTWKEAEEMTGLCCNLLDSPGKNSFQASTGFEDKNLDPDYKRIGGDAHTASEKEDSLEEPIARDYQSNVVQVSQGMYVLANEVPNTEQDELLHLHAAQFQYQSSLVEVTVS